MSKKFIYIAGGIIGVAVLGAGAYVGLPYILPIKSVPPPPPKDLTGIIVAPVSFPLKNFTLLVPDLPSQTVTLDLVSPSAKRDFPMARFVHASTSNESTLVAYDDLVSKPIGDWRGVPIALTERGTSTKWYLARLKLSGETWQHIDSVYLGEDLRMSVVTTNGENVEVQYLVHDRQQTSNEVPQVSTTAIVALTTGTVVQAGRVPKNETLIVYKQFAGKYIWESTTDAAGTVTTPVTPGEFTLQFDANQLTLETDCNSGGASFATEPLPATTFLVQPIASTKMFCESDQEAVYFAMVEQIASYEETADTLTFTLKDESEMLFTRVVQTLEFAPADSTSDSADPALPTENE